MFFSLCSCVFIYYLFICMGYLFYLPDATNLLKMLQLIQVFIFFKMVLLKFDLFHILSLVCKFLGYFGQEYVFSYFKSYFFNFICTFIWACNFLLNFVFLIENKE